MASDFAQLETVDASPDMTVVRALRRADGLPVLLKILERGGPEPLRRLHKERDIGARLDPSTILSPLELTNVDGRTALVLLDNRGHPLEQDLDQAMGIERALGLAIRIGAKLSELHERGIVHRDLKPENVFVGTDDDVRLTGLGVALSSLGSYRPLSESGLIEGTFAYMAPEQTGQTGLPIDQRADLYSLGIILYRMLTGRLPLQATDTLGWIHAQIAERPPSVSTLVQGIPPLAAAIVDKLLSKDPEERYQTARGLVADLRWCLSAWQSRRAVTSFELGRHDIPDHLQIPRRLHGRDAEVRSLVDAFDTCAASGRGRLMLLAGSPGIGKSSLARTVEAHVRAQGGIFLDGKHEELRREVPYFALTQAFEKLADRLLMGSEESLVAWRTRLRTGLGPSAALLTTLVPRFALVLGETTADAAPAMPSTERFALFFERLLHAVALPTQPIVLFLDDLQWADAASIGLLERVLAQTDERTVLTIGAFRDNEVDAEHPLGALLERLRHRGTVAEISLGPLATEAISELLVDAFRCPRAEADTLAAILCERTGGNPFCITELLRTLHQQKTLWFDRTAGHWCWDIDRIRLVPLADEAVLLVLATMSELAPSLREALCVGACLGIEFRTADVSAALERPFEDVEADLLRIAAMGLLFASDRTFRFPHDRVREAAYSLRSPEERTALHLRIGRALMALTSGAEREQRSFLLADQLNLAAPLITTRQERTELAVLDLAVGRRAKAASAHASAARYFAAGMRMLGADAWDHAYETAYGLHVECAACELVLGHFAESEHLARQVLAHANAPPERAAAYAVLVDLQMTRGNIAGAVEIGLEGLRACGAEIPSSATPEERTRAVLEVWALLGDTPFETLANLPPTTDPNARAIAELGPHLGNPTLYHDESLFGVLVARTVALALTSGLSESSPAVFVAFALVFGAITGRHEDAWRLGRVAYDLTQRPGLSVQKPVVCVTFASLINYWRRHVRENLPYLEEGLEAAAQLGDATYLCYSQNHLVMTRFIMGRPLAEVEAESERYLKRITEFGFDEMADLMASRHLLIRSLRGGTTELGSLGTSERSEAKLDEHFATATTPLTRCWHHIDQLQAAFIAGRFERAVVEGHAAAALVHTSPMFPVVGEHAFYFALALASAARPDETPPDADLALVEGYLRQLARWAENCPENFSHKHALVAAELARLRGADLSAIRGYESAIRSAQDNGFVQVQAIAYELAARFYRARGFVQFADLYLREARDGFARWGATAKVRALEHLDRPLLEASATTPELVAMDPVGARSEGLDLLTVTQASEALSAELVRARLLERLLGVMLRYAGARRCAFLPASPDVSNTPEMEALAPGVSPGSELPRDVLNFASRTRERVLLHDATQPNPFSADPYLRSGRVRSVLCLPVSRKDHLLGLIYLENDLAPGIFGGERTQLLEVLAAQAAISLEGTEAFSALELENTQRRRAEASLRESREQLQAVLENMVDAVFVCDTDRRITLVNQAGQRLLELFAPDARAVLRDRPSVETLAILARFRHPDGRPFAPTELPLVRALDGEIVASVDATITTLRERGIELRLSAAPIRDEQGRVVGAVEAVSDITEKVELERIRDQFLRMTAHELKTPVAVVSGYAELLLARRTQFPSQDQRLLDALVRGSRRIDRIVSDLLFLWQLRLGRLALAEEPIAIDDLLTRVAARVAPAPSRVRLSSLPSVMIRGDRLLLETVFQHLIDNAIRYSPDGSPVEVSLAVPPRGGAEVSVTDRGIGIAPDKQARIFELFYRAHADTPHDVGGMGAGLYLANVIAQRHGGSIRFESRVGEGSTFTVWLPANPSSRGAAHE